MVSLQMSTRWLGYPRVAYSVVKLSGFRSSVCGKGSILKRPEPHPRNPDPKPCTG